MKTKTLARHILCALSQFGIITHHALASPGAWDQSYAPSVTGGPVYAAALQPDGKLLIGGAFTAINNSYSRAHLARLFPDGSLDTTFLAVGSSVSSTVYCLAVQTDGDIVIGGDFTYVNGTTRTRVARLNPDGSVDTGFVPTNAISAPVLALAVQSDNKVIIGGNFSSGSFPAWNARLNTDGTVDTVFSSYPNGPVNAIAVQTDGKIVIGGAFTTVNGASRYRVARLNSDGSLDNVFQNGLNGASGAVRCLEIQPDGKILIGGDFTSVNNTSCSFIGRLNTNGTLDTGFVSSPGANGSVYAIAVQPDGSVVIGGAFTAYASASLSHVARLYADGTRDTSFYTFGINNLVQALALQSDGGILAGGAFTTINNTNRPLLGRLYGDIYPPEFISQPVSRSTNVGATVSFSALVDNPTPSTYQWRKDGNDISGATEMSYTLYNVQFADAGSYAVFVNNAEGGATSSNAVLQVGIMPAIIQQPASLTVLQGQPAAFAVGATGWPLSYSWRKDGAFIPGATNAALSFGSVVSTNAGTYACLVSNFLGSITSTDAVLTVDTPPVIVGQPASLNVPVGSNAAFTVAATGEAPLQYQWFNSGGGITNATNTTFAIAGVSLSNADGYYVVVINSLGSATSAVAALAVGYPPVITTNPVSQSNAVGGAVVFSGSVTGSPPIALQWLKDGVPIAGATEGNLSLANLVAGQFGNYSLSASNAFGTAISSSAALSPSSYDFLEGLIAYYPFNGNANDESGNGFDGTVVGATLTTDRFGSLDSAYYFDGVSNDIIASVTNLPTGAAPRTVSLWAQAQLPPTGSNLLWWGASQNGQGFGLINSGTPYTWQGQSYGGGDDVNSGVPVDTNWHQVVVIYDGTNLSISLDGVNEAGISNSINTPLSPLTIGSAASAGTFFSGAIDDVRIYNRALSSLEVAALYALEVPQPMIETNDGHLGFVSGQFGFNIGGMSGQTVVVETSTDLQSWIPIQTNTLGGSPIYFSDPQPGTNSARFYRVQVQ
ncbi:MAG: immunoglobulin domain-containing protein [Verrucomicrobiota bacterium]|jgi:uncharacterized delta-60 repeat protein